jgi:purine-binding chemotaxis protein CheW
MPVSGPESSPPPRSAAEWSNRGELQVVTFKLGGGEYGIDIMQIQEIIRLPEIVHVPKAPKFVEGVIALRDQVLPVIDLAKRFGVHAAPAPGLSGTPGTGSKGASASGRIVVTKVKGSPTVGLIVDEVCEVIRIPLEAVGALPEIVADSGSGFLKGVARLNDRLIILVDLAKTLSSEESAQLQTGMEGDARTHPQIPSGMPA